MMQFQACAYCDHPNPVAANFCNHCGAGLHLKPCRRCGSIADVAAQRCTACNLAFPQRSTINVDIPWVYVGAAATVPTASVASEGRSPGSGLPRAMTARRLAASAEALAEAQRLIEKASGRSLAAHPHAELVMPDGSRDQGGGAASRRRSATAPDSTQTTSRRVRAAAAARFPQGHALAAAEAARQPLPRPDNVAAVPVAASRYAPLVVLVMLALIAALALAYLLRYPVSGTAAKSPGVAQRLLAPSSSPPTAAHAPHLTVSTTLSTATSIELPKDETRGSTAASGTPPPTNPRP